MGTTAAQRSGPARIAGIVGLVGGLLGGVVVDVYELATLPTEVSMVTATRNAVFLMMVVIGLGGLAALGAAGSAWWGRLGIGLAMLAFVLLIPAEFIELSDPATAETIFMIVPLVAGPGFVLAGVAVLRARRWSGWRRFVPLAMGVYLFAVFLPVVIAFPTDAAFWSAILPFDLMWAALGLAVVVEASVAADARARSRVA